MSEHAAVSAMAMPAAAARIRCLPAGVMIRSTATISPRAGRKKGPLSPALLALDLLRRSGIGRLAVGLGAAAEAQVVVRDPLVVVVDLRAALVAHAFEPR